ncbi:MAG: DUF2975 domain-containing protein [Bacteroides sp.]
MKRRLNLFCLLVMLVLGYSVLESSYYVGCGLVSGFKSGRNITKKSGSPEKLQLKIDQFSELKGVALFPIDPMNLKDSIYNEKSGTFVPVIHSQLLVSVKAKPNFWINLIKNASPFLEFITLILALVLFVKLIISINKSDIFNWKNVRRLRKLGALLILTFFFSALSICIMTYQLSESFSLKGYSFNTSELIPTLTLILGLISLIVAEVFAIGLRIKEEQDLTI